jgi:prepilin-type N-terminal cleavage/methylation domain-containing protein
MAEWNDICFENIIVEEWKSEERFPWLLQSSIGGRRKIRYGRIIMGLPREKNISNPTGFTLVELVITMALIMIIAGIAYPAFQKYAVQGRLKAAARDMMGDFANAKARAVAENVDYEIVFDKGNNRYSLQPSGGSVIQTKSPANFAADIRIGPDDPNFSGGNVVSFFTRGTCTAGTVKLTNGQGSTAEITTTITGRTYVNFDFK